MHILELISELCQFRPLLDEAIEFIEKNKEGPFLAYLAFYSVHTPLMGRPDLVEKYQEKAKAIGGELFGDE